MTNLGDWLEGVGSGVREGTTKVMVRGGEEWGEERRAEERGGDWEKRVGVPGSEAICGDSLN